MSLPLPQLDDRDFAALVEEALARARQTCPEWTDMSPADPGRALIEAFAHLTDVMIFRLNRLPRKLYVAFLNLLGGELRPPSAAIAMLEFRREAAEGADATPLDLTIPAGTRIGGRGEGAPVFVTLEQAVLAADAQSVAVRAIHAAWVEGELLSEGVEGPGAVLALARGPVIAPLPYETGILLGVEDDAGGRPLRRFGGRDFALWPGLETPFELFSDGPGFYCARGAGRIFLPRATPGGAGVPRRDAQIRAWYLTGGGAAGNVAAGTLTDLRDPIPGLAVRNPERAAGGRDAEPLEAALERIPREVFSDRRAVTARDFEAIATGEGGVARAQARTGVQLWAHAEPGSVELLLVPDPAPGQSDAVGRRAGIEALQTEELRGRIARLIAARKPLGVTVNVAWARLKPLSIRVDVEIEPDAPEDAVLRRIEAALDRLISPFRDWPPGRPIRPADVYGAVLAEPGVRSARSVAFEVAEAPDADVRDAVPDPHQPRTWFVAAGDRIFRSLNDGASWESLARQEGCPATAVRPHPRRPGLVAAVWAEGGNHTEDGSRLAVSLDCGETWQSDAIRFDSWIYDLAWLGTAADPVLLIATRAGLYSWQVRSEALQRRLPVAASVDAVGLYAVLATGTALGRPVVAVAAREQRGVWISYDPLEPGSFVATGLEGSDIRVLDAADLAGGRYIWAGARATGGSAGEGAFRLNLPERPQDLDTWQPLRARWRGGSCLGFAFLGTRAWAGSFDAGVLEADLGADPIAWTAPEVDIGLPFRSRENLFEPVAALAARAAGPGGPGLMMAAGPRGLYARGEEGGPFAATSQTLFENEVRLPAPWLFASEPHLVRVIGSDDTP
ncbi:baseplate J/gp47 family protein [Rhodovulum sulfidophilum]|uniref:baseplate J/gp47 family protein n=2 Tax=Rhodovulum sulfidophilum TaxID=35806 RepID=UPI00138999CF|nr:baseplate J/gp47 family protein [Rhodovulum sulfidophilum]NDK35767.1 hypothetical protein [Rhodovulum sulfidophilum]